MKGFHSLIGLLVCTILAVRQEERGLSQSTENAILIAGAVSIAGIIVTVITAYVRSHLPT